MSEIRQGEVYWIDFGPADRHSFVWWSKATFFNRSRIATTAVCLITSNLSRADGPGNVALRKGDANLPKAGVVNVSQESELTVRAGRLPAPSWTPSEAACNFCSTAFEPLIASLQ